MTEQPVTDVAAAAAPVVDQNRAALAAAAEADTWLDHVPVAVFAVVMGVTGLGLAWRRAAAVTGVTNWPGEVLVWVGVASFVAALAVYLAKAGLRPPAVAAEFRHPVRINFFPAISISLALVSLGLLPYEAGGEPLLVVAGHPVGFATVLWLVAAIMHGLLTLLIVNRWITRNVEIQHSNPAWFIPVVGNVVLPVGGVELGFLELSWYFFSVGLVFWLLLFTIVFYRIVFHDQLAAKFVPTLFILIAPPAVGFLAYTHLIGGVIDTPARVLLHVGLFITALVLTMAPRFMRVPFGMTWWAYTFPMDAIAMATLEYGRLAPSAALRGLGMLLLMMATLIVVVVLARTSVALAKGRLFEPD